MSNRRQVPLMGHRSQRAPNGHRNVSSEAETYWQYSQECARQAVEAETPELRDQLLGKELNSKARRTQSRTGG
jgi:hypothetical protein